jgi:peptidoglycan/LPS O-acetylase OafA/YrhL
MRSNRWMKENLSVTPPDFSRQKLGSLELGRFIAASVVVLSHVPWDVRHFAAGPHNSMLGSWVAPGPFAVQYFFVLSGFVMMSAHHRDFGRLAAVPNFWWRRACRIFPMYWLSLAVPMYFLWSGVQPFKGFQLVTLLPGNFSDFVPPAWSLRYEMAFYVMFGLCLLPVVGRWLLGFWVLAVAWLWAPPVLARLIDPPRLYPLHHFIYIYASHFLSTFEMEFFAGLLAGAMFIKFSGGRKLGSALLAAGALLLLACGPALHWGSNYVSPTLMPVVSLGFAAVILGLATLERHGALRLGRWASRLGAISYPLYILHTSMMLIFDECCHGWLKLGTAGLYALFLGGLAGIYLVAMLAAFGIDQPLQRWLRRGKVSGAFLKKSAQKTSATLGQGR